MPKLPTLLQITKTATSDAVFKLCTEDVWYKYLDIFVYTNNVQIGSDSTQLQAVVLANDIYYTLFPVNLFDFYFINQTAGANTKIVAMGVLLTDDELKSIGVPIRK
jgi:hypothetical protein